MALEAVWGGLEGDVLNESVRKKEASKTKFVVSSLEAQVLLARRSPGVSSHNACVLRIRQHGTHVERRTLHFHA